MTYRTSAIVFMYFPFLLLLTPISSSVVTTRLLNLDLFGWPTQFNFAVGQIFAGNIICQPSIEREIFLQITQKIDLFRESKFHHHHRLPLTNILFVINRKNGGQFFSLAPYKFSVKRKCFNPMKYIWTAYWIK